MLTLLALTSLASAETIASVLMVEGQVYITAGGEERAATVGMEIDREDGIYVDLDASLYVLLHNNRVVALGEDIEIPAARISGVDDGAVESSVKAQLADILTPSDRERLGPMVTQAEGIGGWHGRLTSAVAPVRGAAPQARAKRKASSAPPSPALELAAEEAAAPAAPPPPTGPALSSLITRFQPGGEEQKCLRKWSKKLVKSGMQSVQVAVKLDESGAIEAVFTMEGEAVPSCLTDALVGQSVATEKLQTELRLQ